MIVAALLIAALFLFGTILSQAGQDIASAGLDLRASLSLLIERLKNLVGPKTVERLDSAIEELEFGEWVAGFIGKALPSLVALLQFDAFTPFLIVLLGYGKLDQFVSNILQPAMQGRALNVSTFMVIRAEIPAMRWLAILLSGDGALKQWVT